MMQLDLINQLNENWLFRSRRINEFTAKDVTELAFLYLISLHVMRIEYETALFAQKYARKTSSHSNFMSVDRINTDLYQFLHMMSDQDGGMSSALQNQNLNELFWKNVKVNQSQIRKFLINIASGEYNEREQSRLLLQIETQLHITVPNYRSIRRISADWNSPKVSSEMRKLALTRLLQALRSKARRGDILLELEKLAKHRRYELFNVCDPETGKGCSDDQVPAQAGSKSMGLLKALALGALAGGVISHVVRKKD
jgi:hypothetical protein